MEWERVDERKRELELRDLEKAPRESRKKAAVKNTKSGSVEWRERKNTT